jgi:hypothetical protein
MIQEELTALFIFVEFLVVELAKGVSYIRASLFTTCTSYAADKSNILVCRF